MDKFERELQKKLKERTYLYDDNKEWFKMKLNNLKGTKIKKRPFYLKYKLASVLVILLLLSSTVYAFDKLDVFNTSEWKDNSGPEGEAISDLFKSKNTQQINQTISNDDLDISLDEVLTSSKKIYLGMSITLKNKTFNTRKQPHILIDNSILKNDKIKMITDNAMGKGANTKTNFYINIYADAYNKSSYKFILELSSDYEGINDKAFKKILESKSMISFIPNSVSFRYTDHNKPFFESSIDKSFKFNIDRKINTTKAYEYISEDKDIINVSQDNTSLSIDYIFTENDKSLAEYDIETMIPNLKLVDANGKVYRSNGYLIEGNYKGNKYKVRVKTSFAVPLKDKTDTYNFSFFSKNTAKKEYKLKIK